MKAPVREAFILEGGFFSLEVFQKHRHKDYSPTKNPRKSGDFTSLLSDDSEMPLQFARKQYHGSRNGRTLAMNKSLPLKENKGVLSL